METKKEKWLIGKPLAYVLWISRLYGIVPLRFQSTGSAIFAYVSRPLYSVGLTFITMINCVVTVYCIYDPNMALGPDANEPTGKNNNRILCFGNLFLSVVTTWYGAYCSLPKMKSYLHCVKEINEIKYILNYKYSGISGMKVWYACFGIFIIIFEMLVLPLVDTVEGNEWYLLNVTALNFILYGCLGMMVLQFVAVAFTICTSYQVINKCLEDVLTRMNRESINKHTSPLSRHAISYSYLPITSINKAIDLIGNVRQDIKITPRMKLAREVRKISNCFVRTCDVVRELNDTENFFLLIQLIVVTIYLVITINNLANAFRLETDVLHAVIVECIWLMCHNYRTVLIVQPCHRIKEELLQTKILVAQIMCDVTCEADPLFEATDTFLKQLLLNDVSFSVMGICSLGRSVISTIIGGATTLYVVILEL